MQLQSVTIICIVYMTLAILAKGNAKTTWPKKKIENDSIKIEHSGINLEFGTFCCSGTCDMFVTYL